MAINRFSEFGPIGVIDGQTGSPICLENWVRWIQRDPRLRPPDPVQSVDPFRRTPMVIVPHPGTAYVVEEEVRVGLMAWSEEGVDEIVVYGVSPVVLAVAKDVAEHLGGRFRLVEVESPDG